MSAPRTNVPSALALLALLTSCAQDVGDIDRTQPNLLPKAMFVDHAWYVRQTVTDVPATSAFSFVGESGALEIVRWEIQQDYLVGYRAYERVPGADPMADQEAADVGEQPVAEGQGEGRQPSVFKGNPVVAYPILDHVDVIRDYNPRTGEQTNVIREDSADRPWYERSNIRVDWSTNLVANFEFISDAKNITPTNSGYVEENEGGPDAFTRHTDEEGEVDYFDFTERLFVDPNPNGCVLSWNYDLGDCTGDEVKVRTSFMRVDVAREQQYVPLEYDDVRQGEFGFFRSERGTYDRRRGATWTGVQQLINRHDLWTSSRDETGNALPHAERGLRPVVYALSPNYPAEMRLVTDEIAAEWDDVLKETVAAARGQSVEALQTDLQEQTGDTCMFCLDTNADGHARIGDLRYSFLYWVDFPQLAGPLGYGPSSANPETGRIVAGMAYVYGAAVDMQAQNAQDIVDLLNGDRVATDFVEADFVREQVTARKPRISTRASQALASIPLAEATEHLLTAAQRTRVDAVKANGLPAARRGYDTQQLDRIRGTSLEPLLINDEIVLGHGHGLYAPNEPLPDDVLQSMSPASWATVDALRANQAKRDKASKSCVWLAEFDDPAILGLAKAAKAGGLQGDALYQFLREEIYKGVMLHEIGHTLGLRHNFGGSADALNYHAGYWPLRQRTIQRDPQTVGEILGMACEIVDDSNEADCAAQEDGRMTELQYSSIMDYGAKFNSDIRGLGHYDRAAIAAGYADLVEVFDEDVVAQMDPDDVALVRSYADVRTPLAGSLTEAVHYTELPAMFGSVNALQQRHYISRAEYWSRYEDADAPVRVPYIGCYDEYVDSTPTCHRWDQGADPYEITMQYVNTYREYYPLVNFQRDRVGFNPALVGNRMTSRYFLPITNMYQQWLFSQFTGEGDTLLNTYSQLGMLRGFSLLWEVMSTPRYGSYALIEGAYRWQTYGAQEAADLYLEPGAGRREMSRYDVSAGYNYYQRVLESGYFYEQIGALAALTSNDASVLGIGADVDADQLAYSIPYYLVFQEEIDQLFTGIASRNFESYGPGVRDGQVVPKDLWLEQVGAAEPVDAPLQVTASWTTRLYTMLYGDALLSSNFDTSFLQKAQVALAGESETIDVAPGFEELRVTDPISGRSYVAYRDPNDTRPESYLGAVMIERAQQAVAALEATTPGTAAEANARADLSAEVQDLEILRSLYATYQYVIQ